MFHTHVVLAGVCCILFTITEWGKITKECCRGCLKRRKVVLRGYCLWGSSSDINILWRAGVEKGSGKGDLSLLCCLWPVHRTTFHIFLHVLYCILYTFIFLIPAGCFTVNIVNFVNILFLIPPIQVIFSIIFAYSAEHCHYSFHWILCVCDKKMSWILNLVKFINTLQPHQQNSFTGGHIRYYTLDQIGAT